MKAEGGRRKYKKDDLRAARNIARPNAPNLTLTLSAKSKGLYKNWMKPATGSNCFVNRALLLKKEPHRSTTKLTNLLPSLLPSSEK